ncbi:hypothetical protein RHS03_01403, partial [Rhizoctonia solani]
MHYMQSQYENRRKKCDEAKPRCSRCLASRAVCLYEYVEHPEYIHRIKRTKPAPRPPRAPKMAPSSSSNPAIAENVAILEHKTSLESWPVNTQPSPNYTAPVNVVDSLLYSFSIPSQPPLDVSLTTPYSTPDLVQLPTDVRQVYSAATFIPSLLDDEGDDNDWEGVYNLLSITPTMDRNSKENTLPFVLQSYARWAITSTFEPRKAAYVLRNQVFECFYSQSSRERVILIANVMNMYARSLIVDASGTSILNHVVSSFQAGSSRFMAAAPSYVSVPEVQNGIGALDSMLEILSLQISTQPRLDCLQLFDYAAPVFRQVCPEPLGLPVDLPNILMNPCLNLRHFAYADIFASIIGAHPTYFQYEVPFSLELCEQMYQTEDSYGLQWLYGIPDQFIMLFAWINSLSQNPSDSNNPELVTWIETSVPRIKLRIDESGEPMLRVARMVVQECWRYALLIYLYMVLCGANAYDPRVARAQKCFMRLVRGIQQARNPDFYLISPMIIVGFGGYSQRAGPRYTSSENTQCSRTYTSGNH